MPQSFIGNPFLLASMGKLVKLTTSAKKDRAKGNVAFQLLAKSPTQTEKVYLRKLTEYPLTPVPYSIGLAEGFLAKTDKLKALHHIVKDIDDSDLCQLK